MTKFEVLQSVVQTIILIAVIATFVVYYCQMRTMERQARAIEDEMAARLRPWIGMFEFGYKPGADCALHINLRNVGPLPAQRAHLELSLHPRDDDGPPITWREQQLKALVPSEEGNYVIALQPYTKFLEWQQARREIVVEGIITYSLAGKAFESRFEASLRFNEAPDEEGKVRKRWRNVEVT